MPTGGWVSFKWRVITACPVMSIVTAPMWRKDFMRCIALSMVVSMFVSAVCVAQEDSQCDAGAATPGPAVQSYVVQLTEFRLKSSSDPAMTANEVVKSFEEMSADGGVDVVEIVRLSALAGHESTVQFGKMTNAPVAVTYGGGFGSARQFQRQSVGTLVRVTAVPQEGKVLLKLSYEASRLATAGPEDRPPDNSTVQFNTTLLIEPGKPTLVAGTSAETTTFLVVSIGD
jgi:hypothetical protein